jgi:hypothetical protein
VVEKESCGLERGEPAQQVPEGRQSGCHGDAWSTVQGTMNWCGLSCGPEGGQIEKKPASWGHRGRPLEGMHPVITQGLGDIILTVSPL